MNKIFEAHNKRDLNELIRQFDLLTNSLFLLTQSLFDNKVVVNYHQHELESKFFRFGMTNHSIINLIQGNKFKVLHLDIEIRDVFSINNLTRIQIESFIIMFYLFFDDSDDMDFRYDIYKLHGLKKQAGFTVNSEYAKQKQKSILNEVEIIENKIKISEKYINADLKKQREYLNPQFAKILKTEDLMAKSGIKSQRFDEVWSLYSNHAHSEHISDRQYNAIYKTKKSTIDESASAITRNSILTAKLCEMLKLHFNCAENKYEELELEGRVLIDTWSRLGK